MDDLLRRFNGDKHTKEALLAYCTAFFETQIVIRAKEKQSVEGLADALIELERVFDQLEIDYGITAKIKAPENTAR